MNYWLIPKILVSSFICAVLAGILWAFIKYAITNPSAIKALFQCFKQIKDNSRCATDSRRNSNNIKAIVYDYLYFSWGNSSFIKGIIDTLTYCKGIARPDKGDSSAIPIIFDKKRCD